MPIKGKTFSVNSDKVEQLVRTVTMLDKTIQRELNKKVEEITRVVFTTAQARRPKISKMEEQAIHAVSGRRYHKNGKLYRVSDPNASFGVPVDTGALKGSIKQKVTAHDGKTVGHIWTTLWYAKFMEFGTSKISPRPFMRQALQVNKRWIKEYFKRKLTNIKPD